MRSEMQIGSESTGPDRGSGWCQGGDDRLRSESIGMWIWNWNRMEIGLEEGHDPAGCRRRRRRSWGEEGEVKRERNGPDPSGVREAVGTFFSLSLLFTLHSWLLFCTSLLYFCTSFLTSLRYFPSWLLSSSPLVTRWSIPSWSIPLNQADPNDINDAIPFLSFHLDCSVGQVMLIVQILSIPQRENKVQSRDTWRTPDLSETGELHRSWFEPWLSPPGLHLRLYPGHKIRNFFL